MSGRSAKVKGSKFERDVRDELKRIYPSERRSQINRVPMSGASWMKGDVFDANDTAWSYEAKKHETLCLPDWWRQSKRQASSFQEPILVFSSNHRPLYWCVLANQWEAYALQAGLPLLEQIESSTRNIYNKLKELKTREVLVIELDGDKVAVIPNESFITVRRRLWENNQTTTKS